MKSAQISKIRARLSFLIVGILVHSFGLTGISHDYTSISFLVGVEEPSMHILSGTIRDPGMHIYFIASLTFRYSCLLMTRANVFFKGLEKY